ncbi:MAG: aminotransferase class I/II-fold pyridoxal phosphate-dependent enzyme [Boseongicola sp.]|nr:aminotransferase class I/II-fold pyridoxal phosphate-dependent enzyme [Boseongicola sp.]
MTQQTFKGSFTQQEPIADDAIDAAVQVLRTGRLHRYNTAGDAPSEVARLERAYADWQGAQYCLALASGGQALQIAMRAAGVGPGDPVLTNAFTLAPVPGAIAAVGAAPIFVETDETLRIDFADLKAKIAQYEARWLLLSHMRGHICDMDSLMALTRSAGVTVIEDCAHTMGARWKNVRSGNHGIAGCFSTQTYKHINSGEGGLLTTDDPDLMARAIILSGSYMLYERHGAAPATEHFADIRLKTPNMSARMDNLRAAILMPQLATLDANVARWNALYDTLAAILDGNPGIETPRRPDDEAKVGSSIQFRVPDFSADDCRAFVARNRARGVELKWFGAPDPHGFTSIYSSWQYAARQSLPRSDAIFATLFDMRLPLTFSVDDCRLLGEIITDCVSDND